jgi:RepB DNA-primase from phage plasmid
VGTPADSRTIAARVAMDHLEALGCSQFDVGVKRLDGKMLLREGWSSRQVLKSLLWLRRENFHLGHIYVRPLGVHGLSLVDDLTAVAVAEMKAQGYEPAVVIETSPGNFQAWLKHGQVLDEIISTRAAKELARRFGGDLSSADWRHFGRLAGFTNPKPERQVPGLRFFTLERELSEILGRKVDLNTPGFLSPYFRGRVLAEAEVQYVAS